MRMQLISKKHICLGNLSKELIPILQGQGDPPISPSEILSLAGSAMEAVALSGTIFPSIASGKIPLLIPVLKWSQVDMWLKHQLKSSDIERYTDASHKDPSEYAFALQIRDNSMSTDNLNPGDRVVCDPDKPYQPGFIVLAFVSEQEEPIIGKYLLRKERRGEFLTEIAPSNTAWPQYRIDRDHFGQIIGKIVEHRKQL